jgi:glycosyltransferase involved in cell wall biosynthesis
MIDVNVIMLTDSTSLSNRKITERCLLSLHDSEEDYRFNVILIESGTDQYPYYRRMISKYITPDEKFNYNKFLNMGFEHCTSDWVVISNNDVGYEKGWFSEMIKVHEERPDIESFSPKDPMFYMLYFDWHFLQSPDNYFESYRVSEGVMGWCIVIKKTALDKIVPFDEQFDMYYQDNDYAELIKKEGIKHAIVRHSIAVHRGTVRVESLSDEVKKKNEEDELKFRTKWNIWT